MLKNLVIIPCRKNSKRIKNKNKIKFGNSRLFERTIKIAKNLKFQKSIFLDSDDSFYKKYTKKYDINFNLRPKNLALEKTKTIDVVLNLIKKLENKKKFFDNVILLQTTSPFRKGKDIEKAYKQFVNSNLNSIVSVCHTTFKNNQIIFENLKKKTIQKKIIKKKILLINGAIYISKVDYLKKNKKFYGGKKCSYYVMKQSLSMDLDTEFDLYLANKMLADENKLGKFDILGNIKKIK